MFRQYKTSWDELAKNGFSETFEAEESSTEYHNGGYRVVNIGEKLNNRYQVIRKTGFNKISTSWLTFDHETKQMATVKILKKKHRCLKIAKAEIKIHKKMAKFANVHANNALHIAFLTDNIMLNGHRGLVFEPMGFTLSSLLNKAQTGLDFSVTYKIACHVLKGLDFLHSDCKIIHTDLRPENIMITMPQRTMRSIVSYMLKTDFQGEGTGCNVHSTSLMSWTNQRFAYLKKDFRKILWRLGDVPNFNPNSYVDSKDFCPKELSLSQIESPILIDKDSKFKDNVLLLSRKLENSEDSFDNDVFEYNSHGKNVNFASHKTPIVENDGDNSEARFSAEHSSEHPVRFQRFNYDMKGEKTFKFFVYSNNNKSRMRYYKKEHTMNYVPSTDHQFHNPCTNCHIDQQYHMLSCKYDLVKEIMSDAVCVKIINLGNAVPVERPLPLHVGLSEYTPPEAIMNMDIGTSYDIWSLGCILHKTATGNALFAVANADAPNFDYELMRVINSILKNGFKSENYRRSTKYSKHFRENGTFINPLERDTQNFRVFNILKSLGHKSSTILLFVKFMRQLLRQDPKNRPLAKELLNFPYILNKKKPVFEYGVNQ